VQIADSAGLAALHDGWIKQIAAAFVRQARFDPLHAAATEQALYGRLEDVFGALRVSESTSLQIEGGGKLHTVELRRRELLAALAGAYEGLVQLARLLVRSGESATLLVSHRVAALPGLLARLAEIGDSRPFVLAPSAALDGAILHAERIRAEGEALPFVTRLPAGPPDGSPPAPGPAPAEDGALTPRPGEAPTHLLHAGRALAITPAALRIGVAPPADGRGLRLSGNTAGISRSHCSVWRTENRVLVEDHSSHGSFLNDQRVDGRAELRVGDRLRLGTPGIELLLIRVEDEDEPARR
jgi:hypothetical protein